MASLIPIPNPLPVKNGGTGTNFPSGIQQGVASTVTLSNLGATTSSITNAKNYPFMNTNAYQGGVIDTTNFAYPAGSVAPFQWWNNAISGMTPQSANSLGRYVVEFVANTSQMEINFRGTGSGLLDVEIDGVKVFDERGNSAASLTAQAGAASTITLASADNATNGYYNQQYIYIVGGTGIGQRKRITGYVGSTKVATVDSAWTTNPDATSTYIISPSNLTYMQSVSGTIYYPKFTFSGEVRPHFVRLVSNEALLGINVDSSGTITKAQSRPQMKLVLLGDSFAYGVGGGGPSQSYGYLLAKNLGLQFESLGVGGTGIVSDGTNYTNYADRTIPPINSWKIDLGNPSAGNFTLTQGATTTGTIAYNASVATTQAAVDAAFGAGQFKVRGMNYSGPFSFLMIATGSNLTNAATMTINYGSMTSQVTPRSVQYTGDLDLVIPYGKNGQKLPFLLVVQGSGNDTAYAGSLAAATQTLLTGLVAKYPQATIVVMGMWMNNGPFSGTALTMQTALKNAAASYLPTINGQTAFLQTFDPSTGVGYLNGSTTVMAPSGTAGVNTDIAVSNDSQHPTSSGHYLLGDVVTALADKVLRGP